MKICFTANPENPTSKGGVAIIINKQLTLWHNIETKIVVPGWAILLKTRWHGDKDIIILGIYAPNVTSGTANESAEFFKSLLTFFMEHPAWKLDYMGGDMNFVEDAIDRLPMHTDNIEVRSVFDDLKGLLGLQDSWRYTYPDKRDFSYSCTKSYQVEGSTERTTKTFQSCIDRIYVTNKLLETARQWRIQPVGIAGIDHDMVSVQIAHKDAPLQGKRRWACPDSVLKDSKFKVMVKKLGRIAQEEIKTIKRSGRTSTANAQRIYGNFISEAMNQAKVRERTMKTRAWQQETDLNRAIDRLTYDHSLTESQRSERLANLKKELKNLKKEDHSKTRHLIAAKDCLEGETVSKYYFQVNKEAKPRDTIHALEIQTPRTMSEQLDAVQDSKPHPMREELLTNPRHCYEKYSPRMVEMMQEYHGETLQSDGLDVDVVTQERAMTEVLNNNISACPTEIDKENFKLKTSREEVVKPLRLSKNDSAPGINGATNKFFKVFNDCYTEDE